MHPFSGEVKAPVAAGKKNLGSQIQTGMTNFGMPKPQMSLVLPLPIIPFLHVSSTAMGRLKKSYYISFFFVVVFNNNEKTYPR